MKRIRSFDLLRVLCFFTVIYYHILAQLAETGPYSADNLRRWYVLADTHIAIPAVAVFFMISGAVTAVTAKKAFSLKKYLTKRFSRLLVPYYILTLVYFALLLIVHRGKTDFFSAGIPAWHAVFNLFGMDGWLLSHGVDTFYFGIGEWFLGALIVLSLLFPLFRLAMRKAPLVFLIAATGVYIGFAVSGVLMVPEHISLPMKCYEFILGMYIGAYYDRIPKKAWTIAAPLTVALLLIPEEWLFRQAFRTTLQAAGLVISFTGLEPILEKHRIKALETMSSCGYELFLTHHIVILFITGKMQSRLGSPGWLTVTVLTEIIIMTVMAIMLKWSSGKVIRMITGGNGHEKP